MANRGRPKGTKYPDGPYLDRMADLLLNKAVKSPNAAIMKIAKGEGISDSKGIDAFRRRLHDKWRVQKDDRKAAARERHEEKHCPTRPVVDRRSVQPNTSIASIMSQIDGSGALAAMRQFESSGALASMRAMESNSIVKRLQLLEQNGVAAAMRQLESGGMASALRDIERCNSSINAAIRNLKGW